MLVFITVKSYKSYLKLMTSWLILYTKLCNFVTNKSRENSQQQERNVEIKKNLER